jgi:uncharacterized protein
MLDLEASYQRLAVKLVHDIAPGSSIFAFGSRTHGKAKSSSDLDLLICPVQPLSPVARASLGLAFEESDLPMRVDWLQWHEAPPYIRNIALQANSQLA